MSKKRDIGPFPTARDARTKLSAMGYLVIPTKYKRPMRWMHPIKRTVRAVVQRRRNGPWFIVKYPNPSKGLKVTVNP